MNPEGKRAKLVMYIKTISSIHKELITQQTDAICRRPDKHIIIKQSSL